MNTPFWAWLGQILYIIAILQKAFQDIEKNTQSFFTLSIKNAKQNIG